LKKPDNNAHLLVGVVVSTLAIVLRPLGPVISPAHTSQTLAQRRQRSDRSRQTVRLRKLADKPEIAMSSAHGPPA
jgi:hypothetical protein